MRTQRTVEFLICLAALTLAYFPAFVRDFGFHNDLGFWANGSPGKDRQLFWETGHLLVFGRPLGAILLNIQGLILRKFTGIEVLAYSRILALVLLTGVVFAWSRWLQSRWKLTSLERGFVLLGTFVHPAWMVPLIWATNLTPGVLAYGFATAATILFFESKKPARWLRIALSSVLMAAAFYCYPPACSLLFWPLVLSWAMGRLSVRQFWQEFGATVGFFVLTIGSAIALDRVILNPVLCNIGIFYCITWVDIAKSPAYSMDFPPNPIQKIQTLIELLGMTLGSWTTFLWGASRNFWIGWILALAALWRQKISIPQNLLIVGTLCALLAIANMAARGQVVAFRTLCPLTLVLGVGLLRLQPLLGTRLKGLLVTGVFAGSLFASHQITARLSDAWISLSTWKKLPELCAQNARSPEIKTAFMQVPGAPDTILGWGKYSDDYAGEFSDRAIVEWAFSGVCHILAGQGPEFSGSRSQP